MALAMPSVVWHERNTSYFLLCILVSVYIRFAIYFLFRLFPDFLALSHSPEAVLAAVGLYISFSQFLIMLENSIKRYVYKKYFSGLRSV